MANELLAMAQQFSGLRMEDLIGAPLMAAANANSKMGAQQVDMILSLGFEKDGNAAPPTYKPIMVPMVFEVSENGNTVTKTFKLPLLTLLPINSLGVTSVDISFDMEVKSSYSNTNTAASTDDFSASGDISAKLGWGIFSAELKGGVSKKISKTTSDTTERDQSNSATYSVNVKAEQIPVPDGQKLLVQALAGAFAAQTDINAAEVN